MGLRSVGLRYNNTGFTLPANVGDLSPDITELNLSHCSLTGNSPHDVSHQSDVFSLNLNGPLVHHPIQAHLTFFLT